MITVLQSPYKYTPSDNPVIFQVNSSDANIVYFKVEVLEAVSNSVISTMDIYTTPDYTTGSYVNLQRILSNAVNWEIYNTQNLMSFPLKKTMLAYKVKFTERGLSNGIIDDLGTPVTTLTYYVWNASFDRISFHNYNQSDYVILDGLKARFLTSKPDNVVVNDYSAEQLCFIHDTEDSLYAIVNTDSSLGVLLNTYSYTIPELANAHLFALQVSPKTLKQTLLVDFDDVSYYTIHIEDEDANLRVEKRKYHYRQLPCHLEPTNMFWINAFGGIDTYQFMNVQEANQITKNNYKKNIFKIDSGLYTDRSGEVWNTAEETINVNSQGTYTATSRIINDNESYWFNDLFTSKKVFVELGDNSLVPVMVTNNQYNIQRQRYNKNTPISVQVNYSFSGDIIPHVAAELSTGFGNGSIQISFIDSQMNTSDGFDTVLTFIASVAGAAENGKEGVGGAVAAISNNLKFEFNKINLLYGLTQNMNIAVNGTLTMVIDYLADYTGKAFRFTDETGATHTGNFINGTVNF